MSNEPSKLNLGDTAVSAIEQPERKRSSRRQKTRRQSLSHCENCGAQLTGHWCAQCGQAAVDYRRSFRHVIVDVLDSFLNWDSKFFASVGLLVAKPWRLTNEFLSGKRVRHVHPLRLYLLASILFFFAVNYWAKAIHIDPSKLAPKNRTEIESELKKKDLPPEVRAKLETVLQEASLAQAAETGQSKGVATGPKDRPFAVFDPGTKTSTQFERWLEAHAKEKFGERGTKLQLFLSTLFSNLPYMMLCCIPLFAFVLKILYLRRRIFYIDHLIYALHIHSFAYVGIMLIVLATIGLNRAASGQLARWIIALLWIAFALQIFLSIRRVYRQSWFVSIFKFFFGGFVYLIVLSVALAATFFITLAMP
ncbi:MAG TPA: DUF3667 domain-containing protein [Candidatus Udaeobacter sp.]